MLETATQPTYQEEDIMTELSHTHKTARMRSHSTMLCVVAFLLCLTASSVGRAEYVEVDLFSYYNEAYDRLDDGFRGFFDYFGTDHVSFAELPGATFHVKSKSHPAPHVLSSTVRGTETFTIGIGRNHIEAIYVLGTGTYIASGFGHQYLWCDNIGHFCFTLQYADGSTEDVFPLNIVSGEHRWSDILHGYMYGFTNVAVGHFPASNWGHYHLYRIDVSPEKQLTAVVMNDRAGGIVGIDPVGDYTILAMTLDIQEVEVAVDIKPSSCPNPLNLIGIQNNGRGNGGTLPVAILGSEEFDVSMIDPAEILLEGVPTVRWNSEDVASAGASGDDCECTTAGPDGHMDLTLKFSRREIAAVLGSVQSGDELTLTLTGRLHDGTPITGSDCVIIHTDEDRPTTSGPRAGGAASELTAWTYPNPFNATTNISYRLAQNDQVSLVVYNILGQEVVTLVDGEQTAGVHTVLWDGCDGAGNTVASGMYLYRLQAGSNWLTRKMTMLK
jgi:hypothetical protein